MRISDWSSDVCSSDLEKKRCSSSTVSTVPAASSRPASSPATSSGSSGTRPWARRAAPSHWKKPATPVGMNIITSTNRMPWRSEEHTSELQSLMRISYAVFCLKKKQYNTRQYINYTQVYTLYRLIQQPTNNNLL